MLRSSLETYGHSVIRSHGDADTDIVSEALRLATQGQSVAVVANDIHSCSVTIPLFKPHGSYLLAV